MPLIDTLPVTDGTAQWPVWSTVARLVVTDPPALGAARRLVAGELAAVDLAASRFRPDSEVHNVYRAGGQPVRVSPLLADLVATALDAAWRTGGDVDPTVGGAMVRLGYDRDFSLRSAPATSARVAGPGTPDWRQVRLDGLELTVPDGVLLDLGATAKAYAADRCARLVADRYNAGVLLSLGGDIATAGPAPAGGWPVLVQDGTGEPAGTVALSAGTALATSSTVSRVWQHGGRSVHHILDPHTCQPAAPVWRTVSVVAGTCVAANTASTAAIVRGPGALRFLRGWDVPARLVTADRQVIRVGVWPADNHGEPADNHGESTERTC